MSFRKSLRPCRFHRSRAGSVERLFSSVFASIVALFFLTWSACHLHFTAQPDSQADTIKVYCAAGLAKPIEEAATIFNTRQTSAVEIVRQGGSGELAGQMMAESKSGLQVADIFVTADETVVDQPAVKNLIGASFPLATQTPVIACPQQSELQIGSLRELVDREEVRFGIASTTAAIGQMTRDIAAAGGFVQELESRKTVDSENVMILAQALATNSLEAAVVWDTTVQQINQAHPDRQIRVVAKLNGNKTQLGAVIAGVLASSRHRDRSKEFCRFLTYSEQAQMIFRQHGFEVSNRETAKAP